MTFKEAILTILLLPLGGIATVAVVAGIFGAGITAIGRFVFYLASAHWTKSACQSASALKYDTSAWCTINTKWKGANELYNWAVNSVDVSLLFLSVGTGIFVACWVVIIVVIRATNAS